ncbi:P-loop containing nucleoside triphosphate hydrolase protein [Podospora didyma]|uniref:RNA helicase n=1 Tax=Podospora didyma TaxID=330526 RepID=A0AAE0KFX1_9PEZI|nr:P-loop containing nucleoside triphosphate hydrolase protein [Podospora didyma]
MWRTAAQDSVCLLCRSAGGTRTIRNRPAATLGGGTSKSTPWTGGQQQQNQQQQQQRTFATRQERRSVPARMVLSDRASVARAPGVRAEPDGGNNRPRRDERPEGPFGGMNRRVANIEPARLSTARTRDSRGKDDREKGKGDRRGFKALNMQRSLTSIGYGARATIKDRIQSIDSFDQFNILPPLKEAISFTVLKGLTDIKPTPVQRLAIPALLGQPIGPRLRRKPMSHGGGGRQEFLLAAETGSGKTLAYLVPIINALKEAEAQDTASIAYNARLEAEKAIRGDNPMSEWIDKFEPHPNTARPRAIVLVPTAELVEQVVAVAKEISHIAKFKARPLSATYSAMKIQRNLYSPAGVDLIVATPHLLATIAESEPNVLSRVSHLVIDEADSLLDRSFSPETTKIVDRALPSLKQLVLCSATIPKRLDTYLMNHFPNIERITTPNLHAIPRRVQLGVIDVSKDPYRNNKNLACADAIWSIGKDAAEHEGPVKGEVDVKRIIVFVNERETTQEVAEYLCSKGIDAVALHRDTPDLRQSEMLASFTSSEPVRVNAAAATAAALAKGGPNSRSRYLPNTKVIVATDLASRGLDTVAVRHVVLYDVPHTTIDFVHRLGRAGRMGRRGRGIVLVGKDDRRDVVAEVKRSMFMGQALV